jgi:hypothetical protein
VISVFGDSPASYSCDEEQITNYVEYGEYSTYMCNRTIFVYHYASRRLYSREVPTGTLTSQSLDVVTTEFQFVPLCHNVNGGASNVTLCHISNTFGRLGECEEIKVSSCDVMIALPGYVVFTSEVSDQITVYTAATNQVYVIGCIVFFLTFVPGQRST